MFSAITTNVVFRLEMKEYAEVAKLDSVKSCQIFVATEFIDQEVMALLKTVFSLLMDCLLLTRGKYFDEKRVR